MTSTVEGIDTTRVTEWLTARLPGLVTPITFTLIAGGHSNLTYRVTDAAGSSWILRRPPLGPLLPTAHDMAREHRILAALQSTAVPVPATVGLCGDPDVNGAPFYVMELVDGAVLRDTQTVLDQLESPVRRTVGLHLADTLAAIHDLDPDAVGLGDLGRRGGYVERQLRRWKRQLEDSQVRPLPRLDEVHRRLAEHLPEQASTTLTHGDFRLDNCIVGPDGAIRAVLDWELATLGDPLADLGLLMVYWSHAGDAIQPIASAPTLAPGFPSRDEMLERYAAARGLDLAGIDYYVAFSYWRLACITEGVYARYLNGGMGDRRDMAERFSQSVLDMADEAERISASW